MRDCYRDIDPHAPFREGIRIRFRFAFSFFTSTSGSNSMLPFATPDRHHTYSGLLRLFLLCIGAVSATYAQPIGPDVRLLDRLPMTVLPEELRIQAGGVIDEYALLVWGTLRTSGDGAVPALAVAVREGEERYLTGPPAEPFGHVAVLNATDRFLVIWNDRRPDAPGLYGQYVAIDGGSLTDEFLVIPDGEMTAPPIGYDTAGVTTLLWQGRVGGGEEGIFSVRTGHDGVLREDFRFVVSGALLHEESFLRDAGGYFVRTEEGPLLVTPGGQIVQSTIPSGRFSRPFFLDGPTGMITTDHEGYLVRYDPVDAPDPEWRATGATGYYPGRDSLGFYVTGLTTDKIPQAFLTVMIKVDTYLRDHEGEDLDLVRRDTVSTIGYTNDLSPTIWKTEEVVRTAGDGLTYYRFRWHCRWHPVASGRTYETSSLRTIYFDSRTDRDVEPRQALRRLEVKRREFTITSAAELIASDGGTLLYASMPIAPRVADWSSNRPVLRRTEGSLVAGAVAEEGVFFGGVLAPNSLEISTPFRFITHSDARTFSYAEGWNAGGLVGTVSRQSSSVDHGTTINSDYTSFFWWSLDRDGWKRLELYEGFVGGPVSFPTPVAPLLRYDPNDNQFFAIATYLPPVRESRYYYNFMRLVSMTDALEIEESITFKPQVKTFDFVPLDAYSLLHFRAVDSGSIMGRGWEWNDRIPKRTIVDPLSSDAGDVVRQRLFGDRYIRLATQPERDKLAVDIFSLDGVPLVGILLPLDGSSGRSVVAQSAEDSTLVIVTQGSSGPLAYLLGPDLTPVITSVEEVVGPYRLSDDRRNVSQINVMIIGDTIYGLWTDERRGIPDVYMNAVALPAGRYVESDPETYDYWEQYRTGDPEVIGQLTPEQRQDIFGFAIQGVTPNPTYGEVTLRIGAAYSLGAYLEIFDAAGKRLYYGLLDLHPDLHDYRVPDEFGETGIYTVRVSSPEYADEVRVIYIGQ